MSAAEISDCLNYLNESGYIKLRDVEGHAEIADLADAEHKTKYVNGVKTVETIEKHIAPSQAAIEFYLIN